MVEKKKTVLPLAPGHHSTQADSVQASLKGSQGTQKISKEAGNPFLKMGFVRFTLTTLLVMIFPPFSWIAAFLVWGPKKSFLYIHAFIKDYIETMIGWVIVGVIGLYLLLGALVYLMYRLVSYFFFSN